jgi:capsular exopolysaccharide synthesis family protein
VAAAEDVRVIGRRRNRSSEIPRNPSRIQDEALRVLRSNLQVALSGLQNPIVLVTSSRAGEGKTSTCVPLAKSLAAGGQRVVLVDLDLRHPDAHRLLGTQNERGVSDVLKGRIAVEKALQFVQVTSNAGLYFMSTGSWEENPTELLGRGHTLSLLESLAAQADVVLIDTPPVLPVADTLVVGRLAAGALLVVEARKTPLPAVQRAKNALTRNQTRILGVVLNRVRTRDAPFLGYAYGYGYGDREEEQEARAATGPTI